MRQLELIQDLLTLPHHVVHVRRRQLLGLTHPLFLDTMLQVQSTQLRWANNLIRELPAEVGASLLQRVARGVMHYVLVYKEFYMLLLQYAPGSSSSRQAMRVELNCVTYLSISGRPLLACVHQYLTLSQEVPRYFAMSVYVSHLGVRKSGLLVLNASMMAVSRYFSRLITNLLVNIRAGIIVYLINC